MDWNIWHIKCGIQTIVGNSRKKKKMIEAPCEDPEVMALNYVI